MEENVLYDALNTFDLQVEGGKMNCLFNDTLNTFYLRLFTVRHMVKDHSDSEREETRCRHMGYCFRVTARVFICIIPQTG